MDSFEGGVKILFLALNKLNKVSIEEVRSLIANDANSSQIGVLLQYITGADQIKPETIEVKEEAKKS